MKKQEEHVPDWMQKWEPNEKPKRSVVPAVIVVVALTVILTVIGTVYAISRVDDQVREANQPTVSATDSEPTYYLNTYRHKFHKPGCPSVTQMNPENRQAFYGTREEAIRAGYDPCHNCNP